MTALRDFQSCRSGSAGIEFALISLALVMVVLGMIEFGRGLNIRNQLSQAADFGARKILTEKGTSDEALAQVVRSAFVAGSPDLLEVTVGAEAAGGMRFRTLTVSYPLTLLVPGLSEGVINLRVVRRTPLV